MTATLRVVLVIASAFTACMIMKRIRESKLQIEDSIFWIGFSLVLLVFSIFPAVPDFLAHMAGTYTTANFIYIFVIFLLIVQMFRQTIKISRLESRLRELVQFIALEENEARANAPTAANNNARFSSAHEEDKNGKD